jgi:hypothetical protein
MSFFKNREQKGKTGPVWELVPVEVEKIQGKSAGGCMYWKYYVLVYENGK